jgi:thiol-disulfide isomerase/thioredoxin
MERTPSRKVHLHRLLGFLFLLVFHGVARGEPSLPPLPVELGAPAPQLSAIDWVTSPPGHPAWGSGGKIAVVEFWATWCPPCRVSIPHLSEIQEKYTSQGLTVVGISTEDKAVVQQFVVEHAADMRYAVGVDPQRKLYRAYMGTFFVNTIPHAFIVSADGRILWHGHPMGLEAPLKSILDGSYNLEAMRLEDRLRRYPDFLEFVLKSQPTPEKIQAVHRMRDLLQARPQDFALMEKLGRLLEQQVLPDSNLRPAGLEVARAIYEKRPKWYPAVNLYVRFLEAEGRAAEAAQLKSLLSELRTPNLVRPVGNRFVNRVAPVTTSPR